MTIPQRVQRRRTKGWRMPDNTIYVGRGSKWGNPYTLEIMQKKIDELAGLFETESSISAREMAVEAFRCDMKYGPESAWWWYGPHMKILTALKHLHDLRGKNLACWCPLDQPCHADVLLELANTEGS
ncbi:DUF4326 domain-containing protein [Jonesia denitrificans]|uniref:DUF4326 domain-containing protein n=1 Tax=Jonesia denitrificans (strain ATCC 14870 / DSM 20603 / BCRC 15368 / CIP 55.134 / JCM 11481 / NBRC 15587 / NCTC 10816 / Prevot 55134) TaxID=471856 RepID=C7R1G1_JONDD|nr:DUF4326 domain-containing protein [Jonesia denitrificans]ACV09796.1 conserved hypothetical protein [Jonesia denitrificans DSM 20603]ACV09934.1 conserved hypothetical protein [Jonesia denitrificans DSM 20603]QXB43432.1 DUF4326 domain-containing protein [Jonesia denitrificans]QXB43550.1 DUF4326 domain-containing protein [Jonesia denitrificans]SQH22427.1 Uncharacterised protein [Jonesia denitrificans]